VISIFPYGKSDTIIMFYVVLTANPLYQVNMLNFHVQFDLIFLAIIFLWSVYVNATVKLSEDRVFGTVLAFY
jgi:hypothetical protein